jgi:3-oxoacyl-[acyl-carrier protein] reductase
MTPSLAGKTAVITGGSKGIGLATARLFARAGARVLIAARRADALAEAVADVERTEGVTMATVPADLTVLADIDRLVATAMAQLGRIDVLVNNVGTGMYKPFLEVTEDDLRHGMEINFFSQFRMCQRVVPHMIEAGGGSIVNVSGATATRVLPPPFLSSCTGPAKAAEVRLTKVLAKEFGEWNIRVNCVVPGRVDTPERVAMWERDLASTGADPAALRAEWGRDIATPGHRWGTATEVADLIAFAASDSASYVNGAVLVIDGGEDWS